jgi:DNA-3-methyladenine glycosylase
MYEKSTIEVAKKLLGMYLVHETKEGTTIGKIVETEAYHHKDDPGSHTWKGETKRNKQMFGPPGKAYVYLIYGMYYCINVVTHKKGVGEAVLIRALEPVEGIELMKKRRKREDHICDGPAKLCTAMAITTEHNGVDLHKGKLYLKQGEKEEIEIFTTTRIGLSKGADLLYRYYIKGNKFISKK